MAGSNKEFEEIIAGLREVFIEVFHARAGFAKFGYAINEKSNIFAEFVFDFLKGKAGIFNGVMENAGYDTILVHIPFLEKLHDGEWVDNVWLASFAQLAFMRFGGDFDSLFDAWRLFAHITIIN